MSPERAPPIAPLERYRAQVTTGALRADPAQEEVISRLDRLWQALRAGRAVAARPGWMARLGFASRATSPAPRGLYIHGPVGRGKSMLMDMFFAGLADLPGRRVHFHAFMLEIHARLHRRRQIRSEADAVGPVAREIAAEARLLCFDEMQVTNIADAMILGRLFAGLFDAQVTVVATSNTAPAQLYTGGLQRDRFLPAIALLEARLDIVELDGGGDYRRDRIRGMTVFHTPLGPAATAALDRAFAALTEGAAIAPLELDIQGRILVLRAAARGVARTDFAALCAAARGPADYLALARACHTLVLDDVPLLTAEDRNAARRFITLIDALYEHGVKLICAAAAPPDALHAAGDHAAEFRRTASRLHEMQSAAYLAAPHRP